MNKLTDLEICERIVKIEGVMHEVRPNPFGCDYHVVADLNKHTGLSPYNPLTDDALCFQLMIKYEMPPMKCHRLYDCYYSTDEDIILGGGGFVSDQNPNKAICLAIIEAHKESNDE